MLKCIFVFFSGRSVCWDKSDPIFCSPQLAFLVHNLKPADIKVVAAVGDDFTVSNLSYRRMVTGGKVLTSREIDKI